MAPNAAAFASIDEALTTQRVRLERVLFRRAVVRLARSGGAHASTDRFLRNLQTEVEVFEGSFVDDQPDLVGAVAEAIREAPEPYRTMFAAQAERFRRIHWELQADVDARGGEDPFDVACAEIAVRAARGALAGGIATDLVSFVGNRGPRPTPA
ncbi:MAG: hypothetical protein ACLGHX_09820 [Acidimicrobiia bacterium]